LHNLITVVLDPKDSKTKGGLHLPDSFADVFLTGTVRAVGTGSLDKNMARPGLLPNDRVLIAQHVQANNQGQRRVMQYPAIKDGEVECVLLDITDVVGIFK
jgi:co-chaperonin GroES (HSP10)